MTDVRIAVVGTGANGAGIAADLLRAGQDVTLIEQWPDNVAAMRADGIVVQTPSETVVTQAGSILNFCEVAELRGQRFDLVFIVVKAYDTRWVSELIKPYLAEGALVVGLQNGMTVDAMSEIIGPHRTLGAVIEIAAAMFTPGVVERHTPASGTWFAIGSLTAATVGRESEVTEVLSHAGTAETVTDIRSAKWMKLTVNAAELVTSAILDLPLLDAAKVPGMHDFMLTTGKEAVRTALATGHRIVPIFGLTDVDPEQPELFVEQTLDAVYTKWSLPHTKTTVLQDWQKRRRGEADELNGYVAREAARVGVRTDANERTAAIARRIDAGELDPHPDNVRLLLAVHS
ncbi:ketopantoate reductase family protein [Microbacterium yannicii]|uniref:ketopantoate reductase family protein n=1 Tax=Microbacterium yannicii TaxID=671622 RepID=UPI000304BEBA|nr:2-dehydropantoate 2-reductase N-terminal domain-containing protein [Microbacterium yannicii]